MPNVKMPPEFPIGCEPEVIVKAINDMLKDLEANEYDINLVIQYSPLINLGRSELTRRESELSRIQNKAIVNESKWLGRISIVVAVIALAISIIGELGSGSWKDKEIAALNNIANNPDVSQVLHEQNDILVKIQTQLSTGIICTLKPNKLQVIDKKPPHPEKK